VVQKINGLLLRYQVIFTNWAQCLQFYFSYNLKYLYVVIVINSRLNGGFVASKFMLEY